MKKHKRFTKQISDGFLARKALTYWRNLIANYDEIPLFERIYLPQAIGFGK